MEPMPSLYRKATALLPTLLICTACFLAGNAAGAKRHRALLAGPSPSSPRTSLHSYQDHTFVRIALGHLALVRLRGAVCLPIDICVVHSVHCSGTSRVQKMTLMRKALSPHGDACSMFTGDFSCCASGEEHLDLRDGRAQLDTSAETEQRVPEPHLSRQVAANGVLADYMGSEWRSSLRTMVRAARVSLLLNWAPRALPKTVSRLWLLSAGATHRCGLLLAIFGPPC